ncbi:hypothetical protein GGS26DRAFT_589889 [Hypomontagnella submonticulosa]|nr:hypothetical protein GGS26DRAFT_589889 [Hypomontagnella submonticulosa]
MSIQIQVVVAILLAAWVVVGVLCGIFIASIRDFYAGAYTPVDPNEPNEPNERDELLPRYVRIPPPPSPPGPDYEADDEFSLTSSEGYGASPSSMESRSSYYGAGTEV